MRKLMWFAIGFGGVCTIGSCFGMGIWMVFAGCLALPGLFCFLGKEKGRKRIAWLCLGLLLGTGWFALFDRMYTAPLRSLDGKTCNAVLTTVSESWETDYGSAVDCYLDLEGNRYKIRLYLNEDQQLLPWTTILCPVEFRLTTDGGKNEPTFHRSQGILALAYQRDEAQITLRDDRENGFWVLLQWRLCDAMETVIDSCFPEEEAAFAKALLLGDKTDISYEISTDFKITGISHIVAVSGLHMSVLFALIAFLTWKRRWGLAIVGIPTILLFMLVTGFSASVTRSGIMMLLMILALVFKREYDPPTALSFAVVSMLTLNPLAASGVAFQLSVGSVAGIFLFMGKIYNWIKGWIPESKNRILKALRKWFAASVAMTLSAQSITTPLVAYYFHTVSLVSLLTNLLVVWVVSFIFYGVMLVCLLGVLWLPLGVVLGKLVCIPIRYVCLTAKILSKVPLAAVYTESIYIIVWLVFAYGLLVLLAFGKEKRIALTAGAAALSLLAALFFSWLEPRLHDQVVTVLDVGQGQSVILQHREKTYLVDCGGDFDDDAADLAAQTLLSMGIRRIDGLILTHDDRDHAGGVPGLLYRIAADRIYLPAGTRNEAILDAACQNQVVWIDRKTELREKGLKITLFPMETADSHQETNIAVLFQTEKCDTLLTGDISSLYEIILLRENGIPDLEIMIAGHHGSKYSTSQQLLDQAAPDTVVISVGENNRYGHPAQETLDRLIRSGCVIYRTDESGTIVLRR